MKALLKKHKSSLLTLLLVVGAVLLLIVMNYVTTQGKQVFGKFAGAPVVQAQVSVLLAEEIKEMGAGYEKQIHFEAKIKGGERKGQTVIARQINDTFYAKDIKEVQVGDRVMICYTPYGEEQIWVFQEYDRSGPLFVLLFVFFGLLLLFGGKKGFRTICSLVLTCTCVFYYFIPAILSGQNIYVSTLFCCMFIIFFTLVLVNGFNYKSLSAGIGCLGGLFVSGILFFVMNHFLRLTGMVDEETALLTMMDIPFDLKAVIFSSILIGVLGGVLDVGVSMAASLSELYPEGEQHNIKDILRSGMNIGRDILCTMTNTLILVYIGSALSLTLLLTAYSNSFFELINREQITVELLQALLGSMGLLFTIPLTTFFYGLGVTKEKKTPPTKGEPLENSIPGEPITLVPREVPAPLRGEQES